MMTVLRFGRHPADMTEMSALGYGAYFTSPEPALESIGPNLVVLRDPVSNATQSMYGSFDYSSPDALLASRVDRATLRDGAGELLLDWSGLQATVFDLMSAGDNAAVTAQLLSGNDLIVGGAGDDLLRGGVPQWRDEMRVTPGVYLQWQLDVSDNDRFVAGVANHLVHESTGDGDPALWRDDVLVLDRQTGTETWVSLPAGTLDPMANAGFPSLSGDGRYLAFQSEENALAGLPPWPRYAQVYVRDLQTGNLVVASSTADGTPAEFGGMLPMLSSSGRFALFQSSSGDLSPDLGGYGPTQVYVKDLQTGALERASEAPDGSAANQESGCATISADGRVAAFLSLATNLAPGFGDGDLAWVYVKDLDSGEIDAVAPLYPSIPGGAGADAAYAVERFRPALSADGRYVAFVSTDATLVPDDTNGVADVFVKDLQTGAVVRASVSESGGQLSVESYAPELSADGRLVVFATASQDVVQASPQSFSSYYLRDLDSGSVLPMTAGTPFPNTPQVLALAPGGGLYAYLDWGPGYPEHLVVRGLSGTGDDTIEGGAGLDTVILSGAARDYRLDWDGRSKAARAWTPSSCPAPRAPTGWTGTAAAGGRPRPWSRGGAQPSSPKSSACASATRPCSSRRASTAPTTTCRMRYGTSSSSRSTRRRASRTWTSSPRPGGSASPFRRSSRSSPPSTSSRTSIHRHWVTAALPRRWWRTSSRAAPGPRPGWKRSARSRARWASDGPWARWCMRSSATSRASRQTTRHGARPR